ncbi:MAG: acyl carrier protein [Pseudobdellovibrio sp.]
MDSKKIKIISILKAILKTDFVDEYSEIGNPHQWDSLHHVGILLKIEEQFSITISPALIAHLSSVAAICDHLSSSETNF